MTERFYRFAGVELALEIPEERMFEEERTLAAFRTDRVEDPHRFHFEMVDELSPPPGPQIAEYPGGRVYAGEDGCVRFIGSVQQDWASGYIRATHRGKEHLVELKQSQYPGRIGTKTVLNAMGAEHLVVEAGGVIFHSSYIRWNGRGILFTAPSETGKSTQADLWHALRGAEIVNGDRSAMRIVDGSAIVEGIPFAGSSPYCKNGTAPLAAVVYLQQAPATSIRRLKGIEAFMRIWEGVSVNVWDKADVDQVSDLVQRIVGMVPVFQLSCTPDESAVIALEQMLRE